MKNLFIIIALFIGISNSYAQSVGDTYQEVKEHLLKFSGKHQIFDTTSVSIIWEEETKKLSACLDVNPGYGYYHIYFFDNGLKDDSKIYKSVYIVANRYEAMIKSLDNEFKYYDFHDGIYTKKAYRHKDITVQVSHKSNNKHNLYINERIN